MSIISIAATDIKDRFVGDLLQGVFMGRGLFAGRKMKRIDRSLGGAIDTTKNVFLDLRKT